MCFYSQGLPVGGSGEIEGRRNHAFHEGDVLVFKALGVGLPGVEAHYVLGHQVESELNLTKQTKSFKMEGVDKCVVVYLLGLVLGADDGAVGPGGEDEGGVALDLAEEVGLEPGVG